MAKESAGIQLSAGFDRAKTKIGAATPPVLSFLIIDPYVFRKIFSIFLSKNIFLERMSIN